MAWLSLFKKSSTSAGEETAGAVVRPDIAGLWNSPSYVSSRHVRPDLNRMEANRCLGSATDSAIGETYTQLRTQILQRIREKGWNTLMVTSPGPGTGKTVTAINLALTFARTFEDTVLLVDCDFRKQTIYDYMGLPGDKGLSDIILKSASMKDVMVWPGIDKLTVISGGRPVAGSAELLGSPQMAALISEMKTRYADRFVFFDTPAALHTADALTLAPLIDGLLIVIEEGRTTHKDIKALLSMFPPEKILGYVINKHRS
ncbi:hypothetical protein JCM14469_14250 [Desulfatiferula olefinivorans]